MTPPVGRIGAPSAWVNNFKLQMQSFSHFSCHSYSGMATGGMVGNWPPTFAKMVLEISLTLMRKKCGEGVVANLQRNKGCSHVIFSFIPPVFIAMATPMHSYTHWINRPTSYFLHFKLYHVFC